MKKLCFALAVLFLVSSAALADVDLSGYTFDELAALRDQIQVEMMSRDEWQEVTVPQGAWAVGPQIPAGTWVIRCSDTGRDDYMMRESAIRWGSGKPNDGYWSSKDRKGSVDIYNPNSEHYVSGQITEFSITLEDGDYVYIDPYYNKVVFTPYTGAPSLGFK